MSVELEDSWLALVTKLSLKKLQICAIFTMCKQYFSLLEIYQTVCGDPFS